MLKQFRISAALGMCLLLPNLVQAHFLWVVAGPQTPDGKAHLYFSEAAEPDDPDLLTRVAQAKLRQLELGGPITELPLVRGEESLMSTPSGDGPKVFFVNHTYGALTRGEETFLLKYYAKCYDGSRPRFWTEIGDASALPLEITPRMDGPQTTLLVKWNGKPLADAAVTIEAEGMDNVEGTTSERGGFSATLPLGKLYSIRVKHVENQAGEYDGTAYAAVRHYATLALQLPETLPVKSLPNLDPAVTSFGGAIVGDHVYVYGGHLGTAHHYSREGQSSRLLRLNLKQPGAWEVLADSVPRRTGTAMVPYQGKLIRLGGFEALNDEGADESLASTSDVASYDPATGAWTEQTPLPQGRSSHDAVVIGDRLYVVGGWQMQPGEETQWHNTALVADLTQSPLVWEELPTPPFHRRAVSLGEWQGKLVVVGGMQEQGGPTRATAIYNPQAQTWTDGPELRGDAMDGFGSSAFALGDTLYVSTMSGKLQRLSPDGARWDVIAQLTYPRFFHRMLPTADSRLLFVGGASMQSGKIAEVELIDPRELPQTAEK